MRQVPETTIAVWRELYKFLSKYNLVLQERRDLIVEVDSLRVMFPWRSSPARICIIPLNL